MKITQHQADLIIFSVGFLQSIAVVLVAYLSGAHNIWGLALIYALSDAEFNMEPKETQQ